MDIMTDRDPLETQEWRDALGSVLAFEGPDRARFLLEELVNEARRQGAPVPYLGDHAVPEHDPARTRRRGTPATARSSTVSAR